MTVHTFVHVFYLTTAGKDHVTRPFAEDLLAHPFLALVDIDAAKELIVKSPHYGRQGAETPGPAEIQGQRRRALSAAGGSGALPSEQPREDDDLTQCTEVTEGAVLEKLGERHAQGEVYTNIGDVLLAVNPFASVPLYGPDISSRYGIHSSGKPLVLFPDKRKFTM